MYLFVKRIIDLTASLTMLILLSPILIISSILILLTMGYPVIFQQERVGWQNRIFKVYKFRTMSDARGEDGTLLSDADRLTFFGNFLRNFSIDEFPQLINVLKGEMSFIGPRPFIKKYLPLYTEKQLRRHLLKPGISGWAQVKGRNLLSWQEKFKYDLYYVENVSFLLDLKIVFLTFYVVFLSKGISSQESVTMPEFDGSN